MMYNKKPVTYNAAEFNHNASRSLDLWRATYFPLWLRERIIFGVTLLSRAPYTAFDVKYRLFHLRAAAFAFHV